jgi:hypothetical protein
LVFLATGHRKIHRHGTAPDPNRCAVPINQQQKTRVEEEQRKEARTDACARGRLQARASGLVSSSRKKVAALSEGQAALASRPFVVARQAGGSQDASCLGARDSRTCMHKRCHDVHRLYVLVARPAAASKMGMPYVSIDPSSGFLHLFACIACVSI